MNRFSERLRYLRKINGVTQAELSRYLGYGYTAVSNYENAEHQPDYNTLMKIAEYFNVSADYLLGNTDNPQSIRADMDSQLSEALQIYTKLPSDKKKLALKLLKSLMDDE